jgi:hypothetical protein
MSSTNGNQGASPVRTGINLSIALLTLWFDLPPTLKGLVSVVMVLVSLTELSPRFRPRLPAPAYLLTILAFFTVSSAGYYLALLPRGGFPTYEKVFTFSFPHVLLLGFIYSVVVAVPLVWVPEGTLRSILGKKGTPPPKDKGERVVEVSAQGCSIQFLGFILLCLLSFITMWISGGDDAKAKEVVIEGLLGLGGPAGTFVMALGMPGPKQDPGLGPPVAAVVALVSSCIQNVLFYGLGHLVARLAGGFSR